MAAAPPERRVSPWNPANAVTASRYLTLPPLLWAVAHDHHQWATITILVCAVLDKLDGLAAKVFRCRSTFGELFDAITDGVCYGFALIVVAAYGWAPRIPVAIILSLGAANVVMRGVYARRAGRATNYRSYAMERLVVYTAYLVGFATGGMEVAFFYWAFVVIYVLVIAHDAKRMLIDPIPPAPVSA
ncbi:MAG: CDP-alcohol phosphatidyltransferase family protein [Myxococcales bacterium]|nr:CDP-alcohol phosphatidyltransferase family protein [Myxococcales bacterium]